MLQTNNQTNKQANKQTHKQTHKQTNKHGDKHARPKTVPRAAYHRHDITSETVHYDSHIKREYPVKPMPQGGLTQRWCDLCLFDCSFVRSSAATAKGVELIWLSYRNIYPGTVWRLLQKRAVWADWSQRCKAGKTLKPSRSSMMSPNVLCGLNRWLCVTDFLWHNRHLKR